MLPAPTAARDMLPAPTAARDMLPAPTAARAVPVTNAEPESLDLVEVACEVDLLAGQAGAEQGDVLPDPRHRPVTVGDSVPTLRDHGRRDPDAEQDLPLGPQPLQRGSGHGHQHGRPQLEGQDAGPEIEPRGGGAHGT